MYAFILPRAINLAILSSSREIVRRRFSVSVYLFINRGKKFSREWRIRPVSVSISVQLDIIFVFLWGISL